MNEKQKNGHVRSLAWINNLPSNDPRGFMVARLCHSESKAELWYYGTYTSLEKAHEVALELENGVVLEVF